MNERKMKAKLVEKGFSVEELATRIAMHQSTFYRKMKDSSFTVSEVTSIAKELDLSVEELNNIFFESVVAEVR